MAKPPGQAQTTHTLQRRLFEAPDFDAFLQDNAAWMTTPRLCYYLAGLCREKGRTAGEVIRLAGLDRTYGYQLFNGTRKPSRDKLIQICFGLELSVVEAQALLKMGEKSPLYPKILRDAAIMRCLHDEKTLLQVQELLDRLGLTLLDGGERHEG
ncbi:MAG: helix-turn-helix transcriptional regulator [Clostridiales bacterium]|nr:helix-turn-helix transcriptional regulator [Clostridiales bacterium]